MAATAHLLLLLAAGRGEDPEAAGVGILLIIGGILFVAAMFAVAGTLIVRRTRRGERFGPRRRPHRPGHAGRADEIAGRVEADRGPR